MSPVESNEATSLSDTSGTDAAVGTTLAHAHARWGERLAIAAYLGNKDVFDQAIADFSAAYAGQNERDYKAFAAAVKSGRIRAETEL